jgi:hypothetical protein
MVAGSHRKASIPGIPALDLIMKSAAVEVDIDELEPIASGHQ